MAENVNLSPRLAGGGWIKRSPRTALVAIAAGVIALVVLGLAIMSQSGIGARTIQIDLNLDATRQSSVGGESDFTVTVGNRGADIKNFVILVGIEGSAGWFAHHVVIDSGTCIPKKGSGRFECGAITKGSTVVFTIRGTSTGPPGTFDNVFNYEDDRGDGRPYVTPIQSSWSETVRP